MRDASASIWFKAGNSVKVVDDVYKANVNLLGTIGTVVETWEKCDVDPTCCCAEQVDIGMAVRVEFERKDNMDLPPELFEGSSSFLHYFAEEELLKVAKEELEQTSTGNQVAASVPFDGMSCTAFKLNQLEPNQKPRGIANFEPARLEDN